MANILILVLPICIRNTQNHLRPKAERGCEHIEQPPFNREKEKSKAEGQIEEVV